MKTIKLSNTLLAAILAAGATAALAHGGPNSATPGAAGAACPMHAEHAQAAGCPVHGGGQAHSHGMGHHQAMAGGMHGHRMHGMTPGAGGEGRMGPPAGAPRHRMTPPAAPAQ